MCDILSKAFNTYSNLLILGNELEEDLEILEEASLQVCHLLNSEILFSNENVHVKRIFYLHSSLLDSYFFCPHLGV